MKAEEIIKNGKLIYSSQPTDDNLRKIALLGKSFSATYYECVELTPLDEVILGLLAGSDEGKLNWEQFGLLLGFDVIDNAEKGLFYDDAEKVIFEHLLDEVKSWGLIAIKARYVSITNLGRIALNNKCKYIFYEKSGEYKEFVYLHKPDGTVPDDYPFMEEAGSYISLEGGHNAGYSDEQTALITSPSASPLLDVIRLQAKGDFVLCKVTDKDWLSISSMSLDVRLYEASGKYHIVFFNGDNVCDQLVLLYEEEINREELEKKVEWALLYQILNDPSAILDYSKLSPFENILEFDKLIQDKRTLWHDSNLLRLIISHCDGDDWHNLTLNCDCDVLKGILEEFVDKLDWMVLTQRMDADFISATSRKFPWERDVLFVRDPVPENLIRQFLSEYEFPEGKDNGVWDWNEALPIIGLDYVKENIALIPFNLYSITGSLPESEKHLVADYPDARWNWHHISSNYDLDFILDHIEKLARHIAFDTLFDRVFVNKQYAHDYATSVDVYEAIADVESEETRLNSVNTRDYIWDDEVIDFFESLNILTWPSGNYSNGFECNKFLDWNAAFFAKYHNRISTDKGFSHISSVIKDTSLVDLYPEFRWDYDALSANDAVYSDFAFVRSHKDKLSPEIILEKNLCISQVTDSIIGLYDIKPILVSNVHLRRLLSLKADIAFILEHIDYEWDWAALTERLCGDLKIEVIGRANWADKWDWDYISQHRDIDDVLSYAVAYRDWWNWVIVISRLDSEQLLKNKCLQTLKEAFSGMTEHDNYCTLITEKFNLSELIDLTGKSNRKDDFDWDYTRLYAMPGFDAEAYLKEHLVDVQWPQFSASSSVDKLFSRKGEGKRIALWIKHYTDMLNKEDYKWDFGALTRLPNLLKFPKLFDLDKPWDWDYLSSNASWLSFKKDYYLKKYISKLSFSALSARTDVGLSEEVIVRYEKKYCWDWDALASNPSIQFSFDYIKNNPEKPWNWATLSHREDLTQADIESNVDKPWEWTSIVRQQWFVPKLDIVERAVTYLANDDWFVISTNPKLASDVVDKYPDLIDWNGLVSENPAFPDMATLSFLKRHASEIPWQSFNHAMADHLTNELVDTFPEKLDWYTISKSQRIVFTESFVRKYEDYWHWSELFGNLKFKQLIPNYNSLFASHSQAALFVNRLKAKVRKPYIYHFTHLYNAIDIIRTRKILSRDRAKELGLLSGDSAGAVVERSSLAHPFARFYFRPCTPTQYYNEALGVDSEFQYKSKKYKNKYNGALNLGLPKCPIPVFFRFDVEEVLSYVPESCYYSDRNMQSNDPNIYKVLESPENVGTKYLYSNMEDAFSMATANGYYDRDYHFQMMNTIKMYSQQEFLVKSELDFSNLRDFQIVCYSEEYANLLKSYFAGDPICDNISCYCGERLFEHENRELSLRLSSEYIALSSDFKDEHYFIIKGDGLRNVHFNFSNTKVLYESASEYRVRDNIEWTPTRELFEIYFVDPNARTKNWLVYVNRAN